jgi:hypothetical protein
MRCGGGITQPTGKPVALKMKLSKLFFPRLERDQRRRAMNQLLLVGLTTLFISCALAVGFLWTNWKR